MQQLFMPDTPPFHFLVRSKTEETATEMVVHGNNNTLHKDEFIVAVCRQSTCTSLSAKHIEFKKKREEEEMCAGERLA